MSVVGLLRVPLRYKPWRRRHLRLVARDLVRLSTAPELDHWTHLSAALDWLCRAQDVRKGEVDAGGVSAGWSFEDGWLPSYPETSGYIVETFLAGARILNRPDLNVRAERIIDWELSIQLPDGAFPGHFGEAGSQPVIFNTGQIMHGMLAGYLQLGRQECLKSAVRAGDWMAAQQDADGCWRRHEHNGVPHTYNTRATWALLNTGLIAGESRLTKAAARHLEWALRQQTASGWFATNAFVHDRAPFTHTIAYAVRGFLESGILLDESRYLNAALESARAMARVQREDGWLAGAFDDGWTARASYCCLTGVAQMSLNWLKLARICSADDLQLAVRRGIAYLKRNHWTDNPDEAVRGGIAGSAPIWGAYSRFEYPNWPVKFFADALMMDMSDTVIPPAPQTAAYSAEVVDA